LTCSVCDYDGQLILTLLIAGNVPLLLRWRVTLILKSGNWRPAAGKLLRAENENDMFLEAIIMTITMIPIIPEFV